MNPKMPLLLAALLMGCTHLHSVSTTSVPVQRDKKVEAEAYRFMFMMMNFDNNYIDGLTRDLAKQCPGGQVQGILTKHEGIIYFPLFAHGVRVRASGYCVSGGGTP